MSQSKASTSKRGGLFWVVILVGLVLAVGVGYWVMAGGDADPTADVPTYTVEQTDLVISITESGTIRARDLTKIKNKVRGRTNVIWIIEEGTHVKAGDLLIELDASKFQDQLIDQQIRVENAESNFTRSTESLAVAKNKAKADVSKAELNYEFAKEDLVKYQQGEFPKQLKETETKITLAQEELEQAVDKLKWSTELFKQQFISESEYETDLLAKKRKELDYELRQTELDLLKRFTNKRELAKLESDVEQTKLALEQAQRKARADVVQAEADLRAKQLELKRQQDKLADLKEQIEFCTIKAPVDGMVVYATSGGNRWRRSDPIAEGVEVRERQELVHLPQSQSMMAALQIHESSLKKIRVGQPARITLDAIPGQVFTGKVGRIALLPSQSMWWNPDVTVYDAEVYIDSDAQGLRTGMKCNVEILVDQFPDTLAVPVQAVQRVNNRPTVWLKTSDGFKPATVEVGMDNKRMVHILDGLKVGEVISLTPPLEASSLDDTQLVQTDDESGDTENRYANEGKWDTQAVAKARQVNAEQTPADQRPKLSEQDQRIVQTLTLAREHGFLDNMKMTDEVRKKVDALLAQVDSGQVTEIDPDVRKTVGDAMRKFQQRRNTGNNGQTPG